MDNNRYPGKKLQYPWFWRNLHQSENQNNQKKKKNTLAPTYSAFKTLKYLYV